jgi:ankyrin repeat protein
MKRSWSLRYCLKERTECKGIASSGDDFSYLSPYRFLWVSCQLQALRYSPSKAIRQILDQLPEALAETYERALHQIPQAIQAQAHRMLQCLVVAARPLRVEELAELLAFESDAVQGGIPKYDAAEQLDDQTQTVLSTCSSLVIVVDEPSDDRQIVQFSHFSVKEFLTSNRLASSVEDSSRYHVHLLTAHTILTQACLGLLLDDHIHKDSFPLAEYAARCWVEHAKFEEIASHVKDEMETLFDPDKPHFATWIGIYDIDRLEIYERDFSGSEISPNSTPNPLYYAALCGFYDLVKHLTNKHPQNVNVIGGRYDFPLLAALSQHHVNVAELLHTRGANVDVRETTGKTILLKALAQPQRNIVVIVIFLLAHGADVDARDDTHRGPLHYLAEYGGGPEVAQILLDHGANVISQDINGKTPLHILSESRTDNEDDVLNHASLFLERGADVNRRDEDNQTPLTLAVKRGRFKLAQFLLTRGSDPNAQNVNGKTPLHVILSERRTNNEDEVLDNVRSLLDHGAKVNIRDNDNQTPLLLAMQGNWFKLARFLLERGADRNDINADTIDGKVRRQIIDSKEKFPPSLPTLPIPPPTAARGRLRSFGVRELSPVRDAATNATQPIISIKHVAPQSTTSAITHLPAAAPATSAPVQFSLATLTTSRSPMFPAGVVNKKADADGAIAPSSTWWNNLKRKRMNPIEKAEGYARTRSVRPFFSVGHTDTHAL